MPFRSEAVLVSQLPIVRSELTEWDRLWLGRSVELAPRGELRLVEEVRVLLPGSLIGVWKHDEYEDGIVRCDLEHVGE